MPRCRFQPDQWAQWIQDHSLSNLSVADFCANHQLPVHSFYFWRRKLTLSLGDCPRFLAIIAEDLEGFVEDRSKLREDRAATNATAFVMLDLRLWDAHAVHLPIDVFPAQRQRFGGRSRPSLGTRNHLFPYCDCGLGATLAVAFAVGRVAHLFYTCEGLVLNSIGIVLLL
jgi:hypothetical protein